MDDSLVDRLRDESLALQKHAWSRMDGGQECSLSANLADEAANVITALEGALTEARKLAESDAEACRAFAADDEAPSWPERVVRQIDAALSLLGGDGK